ncbi:MAG TPA: hypothetical protein VF911_06810 [Thermoanaerobaculia bacterium]
MRRILFGAAGTRTTRSLLILTAALVMPLAARAEVIFGPQTYSVTGSKPQLVDASFAGSGSSCATASYRLVVTQGNPAVTTGSISINGRELVSERSFKPPVGTIDAPFEAVAGINTLRVTIGGKTGSSISVSVIRELDRSIAPPRTYAVSRGRTVLRDSISAEPGASYAVVVRNGDSTGHRVSEGSIVIGGNAMPLDAATAVIRKRVTLGAVNEVTADLRGNPGSFVTLEVVRVVDNCGPVVTILTPAEGAVIPSESFEVAGSLSSSAGAGVAVNGIPADVDWSHAGTADDPYRWSASLSAEAGPLTITATATDTAHAADVRTRRVTIEPASNRVGLRAYPSSGTAPLDVTFSIDSTVDANAVRYELDLDGDGSFDKSFTSFPATDQLFVSLLTPGVRRPSLRVTTSTGETFTATTTVAVQDWTRVDAFLRAHWSQFLAALAAGDVDGALALATEQAGERYRSSLELIRPRLASYAAGISTIHPVWFSATAAHYLIVRENSTGTNGVPSGYHLYFVRDSTGSWRIEQF